MPCVSMEALVGYSGGQGWQRGYARPQLWAPCILGTCRVSKNLEHRQQLDASSMTTAQLCCLLLDHCRPGPSWGLVAPSEGAEPPGSWCQGPFPQERSHLSLSPRASLHRLPPENITVNISQDALLTCRDRPTPATSPTPGTGRRERFTSAAQCMPCPEPKQPPG